MSGSLNKVILLAKVQQQAEIRKNSAGKSVAKMTVTTAAAWLDKAGLRHANEEHHKLMIFNERLVQVAENMQPGGYVYIEGALQNSKWTDNLGNDRYISEIVLSQFRGQFLPLFSGNERITDGEYADINRIFLIGNLGKDPEIRQMRTGKRVASLLVATSEKWKTQSGEYKEKTEWHNISVFNEYLVNIAENTLKKGMKIYIEGSIRGKQWEDKGGSEQQGTDIIISHISGDVVILSNVNSFKNDSGDDKENSRRGNDGGSSHNVIDDEDIRF
jgi:single-strand DNA-binding protein